MTSDSEPLQYRRLRLHAALAGVGALGGAAAALAPHWNPVLSALTGAGLAFLALPLLERWVLPKHLPHALARVAAATLLICTAAGFLRHVVLTPVVSWMASVAAVRLFTWALPDLWPPRPDCCPVCAYNVRNLGSEQCPECGAALAPRGARE